MGRVKKVKSNYRKKTFTIWTESGNKYRTGQFTRDEFENLEENTLNDWSAWIGREQFYSPVK
jgi:hypothetical protein